MRLISQLLSLSRGGIILVAILSLISGVSGAGIAIVTSIALAGNPPTTLLAGVFFGLCTLHFATKSLSEIKLIRLTQAMIYEIRAGLSRKILHTSQSLLEKLGRQPLFTILTRDVDTFVMGFHFVPTLIGNIFIILFCLVYIAFLSPVFFGAIAGVLVTGMLGFHLVEKAPRDKLIVVREKLDTLYILLRSQIDGVRELKLNQWRRGHNTGLIASSATDVRGLNADALSLYALVSNAGNIMFYVLIGLFIFVVPELFSASASVTLSITLVMLYLVRPVSEIMIILPTLRQSSVALARIEQLGEDLKEQEADSVSPTLFGGPEVSLNLRGVSYAYPDSNFSVGPIDFELKSGEVVFLVGGNGSGKTTFAMLLLGLYPPSSGTICLNGTALTPETLPSYREHFSAIFSDFHLFSHLPDTLSEEAETAVHAYLKAFDLAHKVEVKDGQFTTLELSTGQRKRLALVLSYLDDKPIYLFDEWAADQDPAFRKYFYTHILPELKARGKAVLAITHDDAWFDVANRVVKLDNGRLVAHG
ncbi:MAG: cyclic peptide export ABC transporter [Paracoccaceae bacterium]